MESSDNKILIWEEQFNNYCDYETKCNNNINFIGEIKNNLNKYLGKQKKDDILFYKSLIKNEATTYLPLLDINPVNFNSIIFASIKGYPVLPSHHNLNKS